MSSHANGAAGRSVASGHAGGHTGRRERGSSADRSDRTAKAIIRDEAMRLFAMRGADAVTVREIAGAASVSPALVMQHYGSKDGLREAVDAYVLAKFEQMIGQLAAVDPGSLTESGAGRNAAAAASAHNPSLAQTMAAFFPADSAMPEYLGRMLISDGPAARTLFRQLFRVARAGLDRMVAAGFAAEGADSNVRAAVLLANDLGAIVLRRRLNDVLGIDPLTPDGMALWGGELLAIYGGGLSGSPVAL